MLRSKTVLWALRSPCNLGCRYCYFGTIEDHKEAPPQQVGALSHLSKQDVDFLTISAFARTFADSDVKRVILAGGEPLIWQHTMKLVRMLTGAGIEVVIASNAIPFLRPGVAEEVIDAGVAGVSISLDSTDPVYNDDLRPSRTGKYGWAEVMEGTKRLLAARGDSPLPRVGFYSVITRQNLADVSAMAELAAEVGCDYYVPQPISLAPDHPLFEQLNIREEDVPALDRALTDLYSRDYGVRIPRDSYAGQFEDSVRIPVGSVDACFGGNQLFFVEPDGSVWACPSYLKIQATPEALHRSIRGSTASEAFANICEGGCGLFSKDCVSMWPLTDFDRFIRDDVPA